MAGIAAQIEAYKAEFHLNALGLAELLTGPNGAVAADLAARAIRVDTAAKENASGRPGPNVITGRIRGSITWRIGVDHLGIYADIGTAVEYARRLELGFTGVDSLGRSYNAPAFPFLLPALDAAGG